MSEEMTFSEACEGLAVVIQAKEHPHIDIYALMIAEFMASIDNGETPKMALALAKDEPARIDREAARGLEVIDKSPVNASGKWGSGKT